MKEVKSPAGKGELREDREHPLGLGERGSRTLQGYMREIKIPSGLGIGVKLG